MKSKLSPEQIDDACSLYLGGFPTTVIGKQFGVSNVAIRNRLISRGIVMRGRSECARSCDLRHDFFATIDTEDKAYWLGFLLADGCICGNEIAIGLAGVDREHLVKFRDALNSTHTVSDYRYGERKPFVRFAFKSPAMVADLGRLGIGPRKSLTAKPPEIAPELERHFWRGVFDGDGNINLPGDGTTYNVMVRLYGSEATCAAFSVWINRECCVSSRVGPHKSIFAVQLAGFRQAARIVRALYDNATVSLDRKAASARWIGMKAGMPRIIRPCDVPGCGRRHYAKGSCRRHYFAARNLAAKGACSFGVGDVTSPGCSDTESGERVGRKAHRGNRNLASSS